MFYTQITRCPNCDKDHREDREPISSNDRFETVQCPDCEYVYMVITQFIHNQNGNIQAFVLSGSFHTHYHEKIKVLS